jgi:hypothetical protein
MTASDLAWQLDAPKANNNLDHAHNPVLMILHLLLLVRGETLSMGYRGEKGNQAPQDAPELVAVRQWGFQASETPNWIRWLKSSRATVREAFPPLSLVGLNQASRCNGNLYSSSALGNHVIINSVRIIINFVKWMKLYWRIALLCHLEFPWKPP